MQRASRKEKKQYFTCKSKPKVIKRLDFVNCCVRLGENVTGRGRTQGKVKMKTEDWVCPGGIGMPPGALEWVQFN